MIDLPAGGQADFQVQAMSGYIHREISIPVPGTGWIFSGETSGWSNTQTVTIPETSPSPHLHQIQRQLLLFQSFTSWTIPLLLGLMVATAGLLVYHKKHKHNLVKKV